MCHRYTWGIHPKTRENSYSTAENVQNIPKCPICLRGNDGRMEKVGEDYNRLNFSKKKNVFLGNLVYLAQLSLGLRLSMYIYMHL